MQRWETAVPDSLSSQLDRFQTVLAARTEQQIDRNSGQMKLFAAAFGAMVNTCQPRGLVSCEPSADYEGESGPTWCSQSGARGSRSY